MTFRTTSRQLGRPILASVLSAGFSFAGLTLAHAQSAEDFYKGKQVKMIIPGGEGGGYDTYTRLLARHLDRHIPGKPQIISQNMPGASGMRGTNWLYNAAPRDGLTMGSTYNTLLTEPLLGNQMAKYSADKFEWIGSMGTQYNACMVWHTSPIKSIEDAMQREVLVSTTGATGNSAKVPLMLNLLLGTKFKVISGYKTTEARLAVERGEVEGICGFSYDTYLAANPDWIKNNKIRFILQAGSKGVPQLEGVPLLDKYIKDPLQKEALELLSVRDIVGRPHMFPPEVPKYLVTALRKAFDDTMKDPTFLGESRKLNIEPDPVGGDEIEARLKKAYAADKKVVELAAKLWPSEAAK